MFGLKKSVGGAGTAKLFLICFAISVILILLFSLISSAIVGSLDDPTESVGIFSLGTMLIAAALSGIISTRIKGEGGLRFSTLVALSVVLIMLLINVIISSGRVSGGAFMNYGCYLGVVALSAFLGRKREGHRKHRH